MNNAIYQLARRVHSLHTDRSGKPYFAHVQAVRANSFKLAEYAGFSNDRLNEIVDLAVTHDIIEEQQYTGVDEGVLRQHGADDLLIRRTLRLTYRRKGLSYQQNIDAIVEEDDIVVIIVKAADNEHNLSRIHTLPPDQQSIRRRYQRSLLSLAQAYEQKLGLVYQLPEGMRLVSQHHASR